MLIYIPLDGFICQLVCYIKILEQPHKKVGCALKYSWATSIFDHKWRKLYGYYSLALHWMFTETNKKHKSKASVISSSRPSLAWVCTSQVDIAVDAQTLLWRSTDMSEWKRACNCMVNCVKSKYSGSPLAIPDTLSGTVCFCWPL